MQSTNADLMAPSNQIIKRKKKECICYFWVYGVLKKIRHRLGKGSIKIAPKIVVSKIKVSMFPIFPVFLSEKPVNQLKINFISEYAVVYGKLSRLKNFDNCGQIMHTKPTKSILLFKNKLSTDIFNDETQH